MRDVIIDSCPHRMRASVDDECADATLDDAGHWYVLVLVAFSTNKTNKQQLPEEATISTVY